MKRYFIYVLLVILLFALLNTNHRGNNFYKKYDNFIVAVPTNLETPVAQEVKINNTANIVSPENIQENNIGMSSFKKITLVSDTPMDELVGIVGQDNVQRVLALNRIDRQIVKTGKEIIIPNDFSNKTADYFMPQELSNLADIDKVIIIEQRTQSFGFYEYGKLVRSGPISSGSRINPTPPGLYFTNWKGKRVISTVDDSWVLKWNFNIENEKGIGIHQYVLPGYPDSHSCIRMTQEDAMWMYDWADQWVLDEIGHNKVANGTPVIVYGEYDFDTIAPWKDLVNNSKATFIDESELDAGISIYKERILQEQIYRENVVVKSIHNM
jgi:lipoprotein-anchoring transpeptidase ErfK/SrfK